MIRLSYVLVLAAWLTLASLLIPSCKPSEREWARLQFCKDHGWNYDNDYMGPAYCYKREIKKVFQ